MKFRSGFYLLVMMICFWKYQVAISTIPEDLFIAVDFHKKYHLEKASYFYLKHLSTNSNCEYSLRNLSKIGHYLHTKNESSQKLLEIDPIATSIWASYKLLGIYPNDAEIKNLLSKSLSAISQENIFIYLPGLLQNIVARHEDVLYILIFFLSLLVIHMSVKQVFRTSILHQKLIVSIVTLLGFFNIFLYVLHPFLQEVIFPKKDHLTIIYSLTETSESKNERMFNAGTPLISTGTIGTWKKVSLPFDRSGYVLESSILSIKNAHPIPQKMPQ